MDIDNDVFRVKEDMGIDPWRRPKTKANDAATPVFASVQAADNTNAAADYASEGLTKREQFAAMAMQGILSNFKTRSTSQIAVDAVFAADTLIAALNGELKTGPAAKF